jgi:hypothetical protein
VDLMQTTIHESAHAVIAHALGLHKHDIALTHDDAGETGIFGYATGPNPSFGDGCSSETERQLTLRAQCVACCAGLAAEHVFFAVPLSIDNENAQGDFQNIIDMEQSGLRIRGKRDGFVGDHQTWAYIEATLKTAKQLVKVHRSKIERVARAMLASERIVSDELAALLGEGHNVC